MLARQTTTILHGLMLAALLVAAGCQTTPPVQEMSDARQAIMAAKDAGAEEKAPGQLRQAVQHLEAAEEALTQKQYAIARRDAVLAKDRAIYALKLSEAESGDSR